MRTLIKIIGLLLVVFLTACGGGGGSAGATSGSGGTASAGAATTATTTSTTATTTSTTATTTSTTATPSSPSTSNAFVVGLLLTSSSNTLNADGISTVTFKVRALDSSNALVPNALFNLSATNGVILGASTLLTDASGAGTVLMFANPANQNARVSTFTASCIGCTAAPGTTTVQVIGASVTLNNSVASLVIGGASSNLTATVRDVFGTALVGIPVSFAATDLSILSLSASSAVTNASGVASVSVSGVGGGSASVNVSAFGNAKAQLFTSSAPAGALAITSPANNSSVTNGVPQVISVSAPGASTATFASTLGTFGNGASSQIVGVVGGVASATLTPNQAGTASVNVFDSLSRSAALTLFASPTSANKITLNASRTTLPVSNAVNQSSVIVTANAYLSNGLTDQLVANVPIVFSMLGGPGGGEVLTPAIAFTNIAGVATATFTAGTAASIAGGITLSANISGTAVSTGIAPSGNNLLMTIGGSALSVAVGRASVLGSSSDNTLYVQAYSVVVTDSGNNPVSGATVTLRMQPFAFATGPACTPQATYCAEDKNGNGSLDAGEDGYRRLIGTSELTYPASSCTASSAANSAGTITFNGLLTPQNSDAGSVPAIVTTDATGVAAFNLTYLKSTAYWVVNKLTASVFSSGTESSNTSIFRLQPVEGDTSPCRLPASPYAY